MSVEILQSALDPLLANGVFERVQDGVHEGLSSIKAVGLGAGATAVAGISIYLRMKSNSKSEGIVTDGRVRFVDQGWIGLREHNRQFYKSTPIYDPFEQIEDPAAGSVPIYHLKKRAQPIAWEKEFYELLLPGWMVAPHPWRKYKLLNTQNDNRAFTFRAEDNQVPDKNGRLFNIGGGFTWGHITGVDDNRQRKSYAYLKDGFNISTGEARKAGPVSVEQLVFNGIMAGKGTKETDVGDQVRTIIQPEIYDLLYESKNPAKKARRIFPELKERTNDRLLDLGAELRVVEPIVSPHTLGHLAIKGRTPAEQQRDLEVVALHIMGDDNLSQIGFSPAARTNTQA